MANENHDKVVPLWVFLFVLGVMLLFFCLLMHDRADITQMYRNNGLLHESIADLEEEITELIEQNESLEREKAQLQKRQSDQKPFDKDCPCVKKIGDNGQPTLDCVFKTKNGGE